MTIDSHFRKHKLALKSLEKNIGDVIRTSQFIIKALENGNKILIAGNGGSAADAQHFAAELVGRYKAERIGLAAIALSTDTSAITSIGNDFGFDQVFSRQLKALGNRGDVFVGITTSGSSRNIINAFEECQTLGIKTICFTGNKNLVINNISDLVLRISSDDTATIQEMHIIAIHLIAGLIDQWVLDYVKK